MAEVFQPPVAKMKLVFEVVLHVKFFSHLLELLLGHKVIVLFSGADPGEMFANVEMPNRVEQFQVGSIRHDRDVLINVF